ncbi:hypothetical protein [Mycolicibacterium iranicum]|uniref:Uncharacterized protein n=1 Tax=Mycolicibacterium iranicum TaxID=912594 RepID=A0A1X1WSI1_MYCIR|nr:hypothetical protein [Mycolicibacterium iranicum]ORV89469.1 hypothetical protein AWC12_08515 [Mycolicibacterium iranicum]
MFALAEGFAAAADKLESTADTHVQQLMAPGGTDWEGDTADAAQRRSFSDRGAVYRAADLMRQMRRAASAGAASIQQLRDLALDAISEAEAADFRVDDNLAVRDARRYTAQQLGIYESRKIEAATHNSYIVMRAGNIAAEDVRVGAQLSSAAAELAGLIPADWLQDRSLVQQSSTGDGDVQAYDTDSGDEDALSGNEIAERLRELQRGHNRGVREVDTEEEIFDLYEDLVKGGEPLPTPDNYYDRRVLPDGTIIGVRESSGHGPTLDVKYPPGVSGPDKVHLPPPPPVAPPPAPPTSGEAPVIISPPDLPVIDHPPTPGLIPPWAQAPAGVPQGSLPSGGLPPGIDVAMPQPSTIAPSADSVPDWLPDATLPSPTSEEQVGIGGVLFGGLLAFLGWLGTPKVSY